MTGLRTPASLSTHSKSKMGLLIGRPQNFRQISSIIDVDILPETHRRVRLHKHGTHKPLGFYIRDGASMRVTPYGVEKVGLIILYEHINNIVQYGQHLKTLLGASKLKPPMASSSLYPTKARTFAKVANVAFSLGFLQGCKCSQNDACRYISCYKGILIVFKISLRTRKSIQTLGGHLEIV